jgi:hypothetical protein
MGQDEAEEATPSSRTHPAGPTLLSAPLANVVSLVTRSSSLYLRLGTFIGGLAIDGARVTTLTGLEVSRAVIESILYRAGRDVSTRATGELGRAEAEGLLEKSLATLHRTITSVSFAASTGFYISAAALESAKDISQQLLVTLDSVLGSTDSSRAIASIITLIRREFQNPATGRQGEQVGVSDLLIGICGLALLQRWSKKITDSEVEQRGREEVVWDVVVLDDGRRADVVGAGERDLPMTPSGQELARTIQSSIGGEDPDSSEDMLEMTLKQRIMQSLPPQASVSITTSTRTTKTITVEVTGTQPPDLSLPVGVEIVEQDARHASAFDSDGEILTAGSAQREIPKYRIVYRIIRNNLRGTTIQAGDALQDEEEILDSDDDVANNTSQHKEPTRSEEHPSPPVLTSQKSTVAANINSSKYLRNTSRDEKPHGQSMIPSQKDNTANQKRPRKPAGSTSSTDGIDNPSGRSSGTKSPTAKRPKSDKLPVKSSEKGVSIRNALKKGSAATLSTLWTKDPAPDAVKTTQIRPRWGAPTAASTTKPQPPIPQRNSGMLPARDAPRAPQRGNPNYFSSRDLGALQMPDIPRSPSRASYYSIHERRRDSIVSQTDTYSIHSTDSRPVSPPLFRTNLQAQRNLIRARSEKNIMNLPNETGTRHRRTKSEAPSIYTLQTNNSGTSLVLSSQPRRSAFEDSHSFERLMRTGNVDGLFPHHHLLRNITRFVRFASASYGANFLRVMGLATSSINNTNSTKEINTSHHHEHHSFSSHTQLPPDTILLSSFVDPEGGTDSTGHTGTGVPMVHFVTLDHDSKAVVLTCRGTLGFEDVLTDMTCDYDDLIYNGTSYKVHMGIHSSARRLLSSRVFFTIKAALEEFPDYGLVLCGHSLGGGVTALLAIMISESSPTGTSFITTSSPSYEQPQLLDSTSELPSNFAPQQQVSLPSGRPIHVYAYGPPATISPSLRLATRGLITTIVNGQDLVPHLSLGVLHDLQAVALAFKTDDSGAKGEVRKRVWQGLRGTLQDKWYQNGFGSTQQKDDDDEWAHSALKTLRASMLSAKLLPPGEVFVVESMPVLRRDAFAQSSEGIKAAAAVGGALGRPATRSVLRYVRDVEGRFSELRFGGSTLLDHNPGRYEASLGALRRGLLGS